MICLNLNYLNDALLSIYLVVEASNISLLHVQYLKKIISFLFKRMQ